MIEPFEEVSQVIDDFNLKQAIKKEEI